jgi:hypothetical protein
VSSLSIFFLTYKVSARHKNSVLKFTQMVFTKADAIGYRCF